MVSPVFIEQLVLVICQSRLIGSPELISDDWEGLDDAHPTWQGRSHWEVKLLLMVLPRSLDMWVGLGGVERRELVVVVRDHPTRVGRHRHFCVERGVLAAGRGVVAAFASTLAGAPTDLRGRLCPTSLLLLGAATDGLDLEKLLLRLFTALHDLLLGALLLKH